MKKLAAASIPAAKVTVEDCIVLYQKGYSAIINDGKLEGFVREDLAEKRLKFLWLNNNAAD